MLINVEQSKAIAIRNDFGYLVGEDFFDENDPSGTKKIEEIFISPTEGDNWTVMLRTSLDDIRKLNKYLHTYITENKIYFSLDKYQ